MYGQLSPEERRAMGSLFWSRPMWGYQALVFIGLGLALAANLVLWFELASPSGGVGNYAGLYVLAIIGGAVAVVGLVLRRLALNELAVGLCPKCGQVNLWTSAFCRACGTPFEDTPDPEPSPTPSPPMDTR